VRLDGTRLAKWYSDDGLPAGYYTGAEDFELTAGRISAGPHTLEIVADPEGVIAETDESDNAWSNSWTWGAAVQAPAGAVAALRAALGPEDARLLRRHGRIPNDLARPLAGAAVLYVPASAHAPGANGADWRTDLEVHNAGSTGLTYTLDLLKRDNANATPESRTFSLGPQQSARYADVLWNVFSYTGAAALRVTAFVGPGGGNEPEHTT